MENKDKILLRAVELTDVDNLYKWENDTEQWSIGLTSRFISKFDIENYVLSSQSEDVFSAGQTRNIVDLLGKERVAIGCVDLFDIDVKNQRAGVGIYIAKDYRRKNHGEQSLILLEDYARNTLLLHQLYALIGENNIASQKLFAKVGYNKTATLEQWIRRKECFENIFVYQKIL